MQQISEARVQGILSLLIADKKSLFADKKSLFYAVSVEETALVGQAKSDHRMLWLHLAGLRWRPGVSKGVDADTAPGGLIMPEGREIEEI